MVVTESIHNQILRTHPYCYERDITRFDDLDVIEWCEQMFGLSESEDDNTRWLTTFRGYYFKNEKDFILTVLRWS